MANLLKSKAFLIGLFLVFFLLSACAVSIRKRDYGIGYREVGLASWYGKDFHGRPTASGEIYNMFGISAAHKTIPLGTLLLVTDLQTGRSVKVKVNDRGPFVGRRILDLSYGAAKKLRIVEKGLAKVEIKITGRTPIIRPMKKAIAKPNPKPVIKPKITSGRKTGVQPAKKFEVNSETLSSATREQKEKERYIIQIGSFQVKENALQVKEQVALYNRKVYLEIFQTKRGKRSYKVRMGPYATDKEARSIAGKLRSEIGLAPFVIPED